MTCIIGAKCKDGILLGADTREAKGRSISYKSKIIGLETIPIVYASSGTTGLIQWGQGVSNSLPFRVGDARTP